MQLHRITVGCRVCDCPVGILLNTERHQSVTEQHPDLVPLCPSCSERVVSEFLTPSRLRRIFGFRKD